MKKKIIRLLPALITIIVAGVVFCCLQERRDTPEIMEQKITAQAEQVTGKNDPAVQEIWVYVCGNVLHPGVYLLPQGARVFEVLEMAGGVTEDAAEEMLNLAAPLVDGQQIFVPGLCDLTSEDESDFTKQDGRININTASEQELITLPGIGTAKARAIIDYREGTPFRTVEDIMNVSGIKESSFYKIRDLIRV